MEILQKPDIINKHEDPVCHTQVDPKTPFKSLYRGHEFFFHSKQCKREFDLNPQLWTSVSHAEMTSAQLVVE